MGLQSLMWHRFTVQEFMHGQENAGGIHRTVFPIIYQDVPCHIQGIERGDDTVLKYNIKSIEHSYVIFFLDRTVVPTEGMRFLTNTNYRLPLAGEITPQNTRIFEFKGYNEPVGHKVLRLYELYVEENFRWLL